MAVPRPVYSRTGLQQSLQVFCAVDRTTAPTPRHAPTVGAYSTYSTLQHLQHLQVYSAYSLQQTYSTPLTQSCRMHTAGCAMGSRLALLYLSRIFFGY